MPYHIKQILYVYVYRLAPLGFSCLILMAVIGKMRHHWLFYRTFWWSLIVWMRYVNTSFGFGQSLFPTPQWCGENINTWNFSLVFFFRINFPTSQIARILSNDSIHRGCEILKSVKNLQETRLLTLIEGVLAANIFDWGSRACVDLYHKGTIIEIYRMSRKKMQRPWQVSRDKDLLVLEVY